MDGRNSCNKINRNTFDIFNRIKNKGVRNNLVTPEIFVSEIWMQEDTKNGVEIIELNSSNSEMGEATQESANNFSHLWSFVNNDRCNEAGADYRINNIARERRRKMNEELFSIANTNNYLHDHNTQTNFNGFHYIDDSETSGVSHSKQMNCFTIINNHVINSDSSSDSDCPIVEEIESYSTEIDNDHNNKYWDHVYNEDIVTNDSVNAEKRTVWIYSCKNKRRLSDDEFELFNIPSTDTSASPISDEEYKTDKSTNVYRIASPIPATFIPRLDLSLAHTLSTVIEVSGSKNSRESSHESLLKKPYNNWLTGRNCPNSNKVIPNVINWLALSPRENRRRFRNTNSERYQNIREFTYAEGHEQSGRRKDKLRKSSPALIQVDVEVHASDAPTPAIPKDVDIVSIKSLELGPKVQKKKVDNTVSIKISYADADTEIDNENADGGLDPNRKPFIKPTFDKTYDIITEPIEKFYSSKWIGQETGEEQTTAFDYVLGHETEIDRKKPEDEKCFRSDDVYDFASRKLLMKSIKLMKSPLWAEYLPITENPSLHLSLSLSSIQDKKSWFKRIGTYFKCCK